MNGHGIARAGGGPSGGEGGSGRPKPAATGSALRSLEVVQQASPKAPD